VRPGGAGRAAVALPALVLAACGGGGGGGGNTTDSTPPATRSEATPAPPRTATAPPRSPPAATPTRPAPAKRDKGAVPAPEQQAGGAGDEEGNRIPVALRVGAGGRVRPRIVRVPAFFRLAVRIVNRDRRTHRVVLTGGTLRHEVENLPAGGAIAFGFTPPRPATYRVLVDGRLRGRVVTGVEPGP
jgi:hypothetical protein